MKTYLPLASVAFFLISSLIVKDIEACAKENGTCTFLIPSTCCEKLWCEGGLIGHCRVCLNEGDNCGLANECCSGKCQSGQCAGCLKENDNCGLNNECCSGRCQSGQCAGCLQQGDNCGLSKECCSGNCQNGQCA